MKKFLLILPLAFSVFFSSCENELELNADWEENTVIYGLLDVNDENDVHYIKVGKAFLGDDPIAISAQEYDSLYYNPDEITVEVMEWEGSALRNTYTLEPVTDIPKGEGFFASGEQLLYRFTAALDLDREYSITVTNPSGKEVTAKTAMVQEVAYDRPRRGLNAAVNFSEVTDKRYIVRFSSAEYGRRHGLKIRINYLEKDSPETPDSEAEAKSILWTFTDTKVSRINGGEDIEYTIEPEEFFNKLANEIEANGKYRYFANPKRNATSGLITAESFDFIYPTASPDLSVYLDLTDPSSSLVEDRPVFNNITNGVGLFTSRNVSEINFVPLHSNTMKEILTNPKTQDLNFGYYEYQSDEFVVIYQ